MKEIEIIGKRKAREKHFLKKNGIIVANVYDEDIHFLNNGKYEEIDNSLVDNGKYYTNKNNAYKADFYKNTKDGLTNISIGDKYVKTSLININETSLEENITESKLHKNVRYNDVLDNVDLEYNIMPTKVKENIIIKNKDADVEKLVFIIETNVELSATSNNMIVAKDDDKVYFEFDAPYMMDANDKINRDVNYELSKIKEGKYLLKIKVDHAWLDGEEISYPVTIDPTITNSGQNNSVYDTYIRSGSSADDTAGSFYVLEAGVCKVVDEYITNRTLIKFDLPTIGTGSQIINASLNLIGFPVFGVNVDSQIVNVHRVTVPWEENTATWNTMNDKYDPRIEGSFYNVRSSMDESGNVQASICGTDLTNLVKKWYTGTPNNGIMLKTNEEIYVEGDYPIFYSSNNQTGGSNPKPILAISYRTQNGIEGYMDYQTQNFSIGSTYTNNYNGNLTAMFDIGKTIGGKMPAELNIVYNTNDVVLNNNVGYGLGYRLSLHQTVREQVIDNVTYLEYTDEDGTTHYFINKKTSIDENGFNTTNTGNVYYDEDGLNLEITKNANDYVLKDKNGNKMKFIKNGNTAYLSEIEDVYGNKNFITYNNNLITKVVDANNAEININYEDNKTTITSPDQTVILNYLGTKLISINSLLGVTGFQYNTNNLISKIIDIDGVKTSYEYYDQKPYKIKKVSEYGTEDTLGEYFEVSYGFDSTTITDSKQNAKNIIFNSQGSVVSVSGLKSKDDINNAYGISSVSGVDDYGINPGSNNKLLSSELPLKYVNNLLFDTSFEQIVGYFKPDISDILKLNVMTSDEASRTGEKSLKINNNKYDNKIVPYTGSIKALKGKYYTFSSYVKNTNKVRLQIKYEDKDSQIVEAYSEIIEPSDDFERYDVTIYYPLDATSDLSVGINILGIGDTYIDDIQLEEGEVANNYNLLENSDFKNGLNDWELSVQNVSNGNTIAPNSVFEVVTLDNNVNAVKVKLNPIHSVSMQRKFNISGKGGDAFNISFWYKNEGIDSNLSEYYGSRVYVTFHYVDQNDGHCVIPSPMLNPNDESWQYVSNYFTAEKDYNSISLEIQHEYTANDFYLTNLNLFKDIRQVNYEYDESGNVILSSDLDNKADKFNYDKNNQLIKMTNPKGKNFLFEYDNLVTDRVINGISDMGISNEVKFDNNNNPVLTRIRKNNLSGNITDGLYQIRLKGTDKFIRNINNSIKVNSDDSHDLWYLEKVDDNYKIRHSIISDKYFAVQNSQLILTNYDNDNSLFTLTKNENGSYKIKVKTQDKYIKFNDEALEISSLVEKDYHFEFYFEPKDSTLFMENNAEYTDDGKFIKSTTDTLGNTTKYDVDLVTGLNKSITDAKGIVTNYGYNDKKQISSVTSGNMSVSYVYNDKNNLSKIKHGKKEYNFDYDEFSNVKTIKIGEKICLVTNHYDNSGDLTSFEYGNNGKVNYEYDEFYRLKKMVKDNNTYDYKYNGHGDLVKIISDKDTLKYTYDLSKKLIEYQFNDFKVKYKYDSNENPVNTKYNFENVNNEVINTFNDDDLVTKTAFNNNEINYNYDSLGRIKNSNINNLFNTNYEYLNNGNKTSLTVDKLTSGDDTYSYKYDKLNNITHIYHNNELENKYYYDDYNQLIKEIDYLRKQIIKYKYDNVGNILSENVYELDTYSLIKQNKYKYNNPDWEDQLTEYNDDLITYDEIGNPITIGNNKTMNWVNGRELDTYNDGVNVVKYKYNVNGIRTSKTINNVETKYYIEDKDIIFEQTGNNVLYYIRSIMDGLVGFEYNNDLYYYMKNIQDDVIGILDSDFNVVAKYKYDSWGRVISITDNKGRDISSNDLHIANINPFRYRSYYYDKETKLYYLNSRYYNPELKRFINSDSYGGEVGGNILTHNIYAYALNNPILYCDTEGSIAGFASAIINFAAKLVVGVVASAGAKAVSGIISGVISAANSLVNDVKNFISSIKKKNKAKAKTKTASEAKVRTQTAIKKLSKNPNKPCAPAERIIGTVLPINKPFTIREAQIYVQEKKNNTGNVVCINKASAKRVARGANKKGKYRDEAHENEFGYFPHYHDTEKFNHAHIWYYLTP